jgi:hypothetical protein
VIGIFLKKFHGNIGCKAFAATGFGAINQKLNSAVWSWRELHVLLSGFRVQWDVSTQLQRRRSNRKASCCSWESWRFTASCGCKTAAKTFRPETHRSRSPKRWPSHELRHQVFFFFFFPLFILLSVLLLTIIQIPSPCT